MSVQARKDTSNKSFILDSSLSLSEDDAVFLQDGGRATPLLFGTLVAKIAASQKYVPYTDETAVNGTAVPAGVYIGADIPAADLVAGDVVDSIVLLGGGALIDENKLVIENGKLLTTVIGATLEQRTVEDELNKRGIFVGASEDSTSFET